MRAVAPRPDSRTFHRCSSSASSSNSFIDGRILAFFEALHQLAGLVVGLLLALAAELDQQPAAPFGQERDVLRVDALLLHVVDEDVVEPFQPGRLGLQDLGDVVAGAVDVGIAEHQQRLDGRAVDQVQARLQDGDARPLRAREGPGDVEALLGQQVVEVVAGDPARQVLGIAAADLVGVAVAEVLEPGVDLSLAPAGRG